MIAGQLSQAFRNFQEMTYAKIRMVKCTFDEWCGRIVEWKERWFVEAQFTWARTVSQSRPGRSIFVPTWLWQGPRLLKARWRIPPLTRWPFRSGYPRPKKQKRLAAIAGKDLRSISFLFSAERRTPSISRKLTSCKFCSLICATLVSNLH